MSDILIRPATLDDLEMILRLDRFLFQFDAQYDDTLDFEWTRSEEGVTFFTDRIIGKEGVAFIAEYDNHVVGYLCGAITEANSYRRIKRIAELECMFVQPSTRGKGAGAGLVNAFLDWVRAQDIHDVRIEASAENETAISFYQRMGFTPYNLILEGRLG
jgi:GNAT superfamily N-acetyltransferase